MKRLLEGIKYPRPLSFVALAIVGVLTSAVYGCNENVETGAEENDLVAERDPVETLDADLVDDIVIGGRLYDSWYSEADLTAPLTPNPLGVFADGTFENDISKGYRCKTCHGWDYEGAYGFAGVMDTASNLSLEEIENVIANGFSFRIGTDEYLVHNFTTLGLVAADITALAKFVKYGVVDTSDYIYSFRVGKGDMTNGQSLYDGDAGCAGGSCHDNDGKGIDFADGNPAAGENEFVGTIGQKNPQEMLHKIRFGHAGETGMPAIYDDPNFTTQDAADIMTYTQQLPAE